MIDDIVVCNAHDATSSRVDRPGKGAELFQLVCYKADQRGHLETNRLLNDEWHLGARWSERLWF